MIIKHFHGVLNGGCVVKNPLMVDPWSAEVGFDMATEGSHMVAEYDRVLSFEF